MFEKVDSLRQAIVFLKMLQDDSAVPKGMKEKMLSTIVVLEGVEPLMTKKNKAMAVLESLSDDPNMPSMTRTQLYSVISLLEVA